MQNFFDFISKELAINNSLNDLKDFIKNLYHLKIAIHNTIPLIGPYYGFCVCEIMYILNSLIVTKNNMNYVIFVCFLFLLNLFI